jgi:protein TonB
MAAPMSDRANHRRVLHFAVTGVLLGAVGCTSNEPPKGDAKPEQKTKAIEPQTKEPDPIREFAPNPGPNELERIPPQPEVAPTTAVKPEPEPEPEPEDIVNEGPVKEPVPVGINEGPQKEPEPKPEPKRVNTGPIEKPRPPIKVNPGPEG